jgi:hypothetical protein
MRTWSLIAILSLVAGIAQVLWVLGNVFGVSVMAWKAGSWTHAITIGVQWVPVFFLLSLAFIALGVASARYLRPSAARAFGLVGVKLLVFGSILWAGLLLSPFIAVVRR